jgi:hypothetical protein
LGDAWNEGAIRFDRRFGFETIDTVERPEKNVRKLQWWQDRGCTTRPLEPMTAMLKTETSYIAAERYGVSPQNAWISSTI